MNIGRSRQRARGWHEIAAFTDFYQVAPGPDGVRAGRKYVQTQVLAHCDEDLACDAALVTGELLANAHQHGAPPVVVRLAVESARVHLEVSDASPRWPILGPATSSNMTGRGLTLVDSISASWGVRREPEGGKTVWCELSNDPVAVPAASRLALEAIFDDGFDEASTEPRFTVVLGDVSTKLLIDAKAHIDNLVREFSLASQTASDIAEVPDHLVDLITTVVHGFSDAREAIKRQALAAAQRDEPRTALTLHLPLSAADAGEAYLKALDEADRYARAARILTLETPPEHRIFRHWYVEAVIEQLRRLAAGEPPIDIEPFEARLLSEIRSLAAARRVADRAVRLQRVTAALARARTPEDVASVVISEAVAALGASGGGLLVPATDGEHLAVPGAVGYGDKLMGQFREERLDAPLPAATALRTGEAIFLESPEERDAHFPMLRGFEPSTIAMCTVPLIAGRRSIGALRFSFNTPKLFDDAERNFVMALATQTAQTLLRTEIYEAERQATLGLQRALLPQAVSGIPGWDVAAYYSPAGGYEVGGDFYDVVPVPDGRIAAIVGDVMGRGLQAAAAMAEIRSTIRAYVLDDADPATVFRRVDAYFNATQPDQLVTVLYFLVDRQNDLVQIANAGHLPPLLVRPGEAEILPVSGGLPFGVDGEERTVTAVRIPPGTAVAAITDGLVERRGEDIDVGINRLLEATARAHWTSAHGLMNRIVDAGSTPYTHDDDLTALVLLRE